MSDYLITGFGMNHVDSVSITFISTVMGTGVLSRINKRMKKRLTHTQISWDKLELALRWTYNDYFATLNLRELVMYII